MIDIQNPDYCPTLEEFSDYIRNPLFDRLCSEIQAEYRVAPQMDFSKCSWIPGWNIKFKKSGKSLCTIYPKESFFTVLVVVGRKEKAAVEHLLPDCSPEMRSIYHATEEGNGQRWPMVDLEDEGRLYDDVKTFIKIRHKVPDEFKGAIALIT